MRKGTFCDLQKAFYLFTRKKKKTAEEEKGEGRISLEKGRLASMWRTGHTGKATNRRGRRRKR